MYFPGQPKIGVRNQSKRRYHTSETRLSPERARLSLSNVLNMRENARRCVLGLHLVFECIMNQRV